MGILNGDYISLKRCLVGTAIGCFGFGLVGFCSGLIFADRIRSNDSSPSNFERVILDSLHQCQYNLRELSESNVTIGECVNHCAKTCNEALESTLDDSLDSNLDNPDQCPSQLRTCRLYLERCRRTDPSPGTLPYTPTNPIYTSNSPNLRG